MAIAALAVWALTAGAGAYLLAHVIASKRAAAARDVPEPAPAPATAGAPPGPVRPPPIPRTKVYAGPDDHPLREFSHPALALCGLGLWGAFVATHKLAFAWIGGGVLAVTAGIGFSWLVGNLRAARRRRGGSDGERPGVPPHLVAVHGLAAATTTALVLLALVFAARG